MLIKNMYLSKAYGAQRLSATETCKPPPFLTNSSQFSA